MFDFDLSVQNPEFATILGPCHVIINTKLHVIKPASMGCCIKFSVFSSSS